MNKWYLGNDPISRHFTSPKPLKQICYTYWKWFIMSLYFFNIFIFKIHYPTKYFFKTYFIWMVFFIYNLQTYKICSNQKKEDKTRCFVHLPRWLSLLLLRVKNKKHKTCFFLVFMCHDAISFLISYHFLGRHHKNMFCVLS